MIFCWFMTTFWTANVQLCTLLEGKVWYIPIYLYVIKRQEFVRSLNLHLGWKSMNLVADFGTRLWQHKDIWCIPKLPESTTRVWAYTYVLRMKKVFGFENWTHLRWAQLLLVSLSCTWKGQGTLSGVIEGHVWNRQCQQRRSRQQFQPKRAQVRWVMFSEPCTYNILQSFYFKRESVRAVIGEQMFWVNCCCDCGLTCCSPCLARRLVGDSFLLKYSLRRASLLARILTLDDIYEAT